MRRDITSANSKVVLTCALFPAGLQFQGYAADNAWTTEVVNAIESRMGADGKASYGFTPVIHNITFHFSPDSDTIERLSYLNQVQNTTKTPQICQMAIEIPSLGKNIFLKNGCMTGSNYFPSAAKVLEPQDVTFNFEDVAIV